MIVNRVHLMNTVTMFQGRKFVNPVVLGAYSAQPIMNVSQQQIQNVIAMLVYHAQLMEIVLVLPKDKSV